ncbi:MAG: type II toxin-antitoxin system VapC family toxin [Chloroflexi bacterium]|nr:type II toxin-antitoxin system VapC family toxin [Chloroflexota bacterium]
MIVLDASALVEFLLGTDAGLLVRERVRREAGDVHAPHLVDLEVTQTLRSLLFRQEVTASRCREALEVLQDMRIVRHPHRPYLARIWELRASITAYDAAYVALAEALGAPLWTRDGKLARAVGHRASVELV